MLSSFFRIDKVTDHALLRYEQALTHSSYAKERRDQGYECADYERLEFLGDRILNCAIADFLYHTYTKAPEGILTARIKFTKNETLACIVKTKIPEIRPLIRIGNNQKITDAILADVFEALIGAIYLDPVYGITKIHETVNSSLADDIRAFNTTEDYISQLQTYVQQILQKPLTDLVYVQISDHVDNQNRHTFVYEVRLQGQSIGRGTGSKSKAAKQLAAKFALQKF